MSTLKVFVDLMSQPARTLLMFLKAANIPFEQKIVSIAKLEHKQPEYLQIHKFGKIPAIEDNGVKIIENVAILRYLSRKYDVPDYWYPKDLIARARVDEFLEWQHIGLRVPVASFFAAEFITPLFTGKATPPKTLERLQGQMIEALGNMENIWLRDSPYVTGPKISIADLVGLTEIEQLYLTSYNPLDGRPKLAAWIERIHSDLKPHYDDVHKIFNKVKAQKGNKEKSKL